MVNQGINFAMVPMSVDVDMDSYRRFLAKHPLLQQEDEEKMPNSSSKHVSLKNKKSEGAPAKIPAVIQAFAQCLNHFLLLSHADDASPGNPLDKPLGAFESSEIPAIPLKDYVERIYTYANCSPSCFVIAYVYLKRIAGDSCLHGGSGLLSGAQITRFNVHRLVLLSVVTACKFVDDIYYKQNFYAKIGGIATEELNCLEREFLYLLDYRMFVSSDTFSNSLMELELELELNNAGSSADSVIQTCSNQPNEPLVLFRNSFVQPKAC